MHTTSHISLRISWPIIEFTQSHKTRHARNQSVNIYTHTATARFANTNHTHPMQFADSPHPSLTPSLGRVIDLNRVRVQSGNLRQILGVQNGAVFAVARLVRQRDEAGVAVRDVDNGAGQRQRLDDVVGVLNGTDVHRCDAGQHLAGYVRLHGQRNVAQVQVAAVRVRIEEGQIDALVPVMARYRIE